MNPRSGRTPALAAVVFLSILSILAGCAAPWQAPEGRVMTAEEGRALVARHLPARLKDREGWATDIHAAFASLQIPLTAANACAVIAITEQESGFQVDPAVPNMGAIAWKEIERQRERLGIPKLALQAALALPSTNGKSYSERIDASRTEKDLSDIFEDFIGRIPLGRRLFEDRNPVHTAGPMQVSIAFAREQAAKSYPYPMRGSIRDEVFTRRGGMYFGIAHLMGYPAPYDDVIYRFADFNAGRYASRNAAFQAAVSSLSGVPLATDGDLVRFESGHPAKEPGATELATRVLASRLGLSQADIRRDLETGESDEFAKTRLYERVFALADRTGKPAARAVIPRIELHSPKITRKFTTEAFARRVAQRHRDCLARG
ncbi:MAG TPA: DUF1615 domain-containing protein [Usitatibacter sp.]|nr:DUF1615 domain-containing protein [Usitatibacter sp.]